MSRPLAAFALALTVCTPAFAQDFEFPDPSDLVNSKFSPTAFSRLSSLELYDIGIALKRGRTILILGCTASQSRAVFEASIEQGAPANDLLRATCGN